MRDRFDRDIDYIRFSITDRCNLRCQYCMPQGVPLGCHQDLLTFEEFLQVAQAAVELGVTRFKVTGGEPLVRRGCLDFLRRLKALPGVEQVTLTTNGVLLAPLVPALKEMGLDGVNISLDDPTPAGFRAITGFDLLPPVLEGLSACVAAGLRTKLNCVLLPGCEGRLPAMAAFAQGQPVDVRFIEVMPIGEGARHPGPTQEQALAILPAALAGPPAGGGGPRQRPRPLLRQCGPHRPHRHDRRGEPQVLRRVQPGAAHQHRGTQALPLLRGGRRPAGRPPGQRPGGSSKQVPGRRHLEQTPGPLLRQRGPITERKNMSENRRITTIGKSDRHMYQPRPGHPKAPGARRPLYGGVGHRRGCPRGQLAPAGEFALRG